MASAVNVGRVMPRADARMRHTVEVRFDPRTNQIFTTSGTVISATTFARTQEIIPFDDGGYLVRPRAAQTADDYLVLHALNDDPDTQAWLDRCFG